MAAIRRSLAAWARPCNKDHWERTWWFRQDRPCHWSRLAESHRLSQYAGAEGFYTAGATAELSAQVRNEFNAKPLIATLIETANANGVTIYPVFAEGLGSGSMPSGDIVSR